MLGCLELEVSRQRSRPIKLGFTKLNFVLKSAIWLNVREPGGRGHGRRREVVGNVQKTGKLAKMPTRVTQSEIIFRLDYC